MANGGDESEVLRYLRSIDAKLGRLNEQLETFLSAPKSKRAARTKRDPAKAVLGFSTTEAAEEYLRTHPDADVDVVVTGVPRAPDGLIGAQSPELSPEPGKKRSDSNAD
jgi:hypothetical protein